MMRRLQAGWDGDAYEGLGERWSCKQMELRLHMLLFIRISQFQDWQNRDGIDFDTLALFFPLTK